MIYTGPRPVMPTAAVCHGFERLQTSIATMFELKKVVDKMEMEHKIKSHSDKVNIIFPPLDHSSSLY